MSIISENVIPIAIFAVIVALVAVLAFVFKRIVRVAPDQALLVVGKTKEGAATDNAEAEISEDTKIIIGGGWTFVMPIFQEAFSLSLEQYQVKLAVNGPDKNRIDTSVVANVNFKVQGNKTGVRKAAQRFLHKQETLKNTVQDSLEGALRDVIGSMTIDEILSDKDKFKESIVIMIKNTVDDQGLQIDQINISSIDTPKSDYLKNLSRKESVRVEQEAAITTAAANQASQSAIIESNERIAERNRDFTLKKAAIAGETAKAEAAAQSAGQIAQAEQDKIIAKSRQEALIEEAEVKNTQLTISVRKPAEAEAYAQVQEANAARDTKKAQTEASVYERVQLAEANKSSTILDAEGAAAKVVADANAHAEGVIAAGNAERERLVATSVGIEAHGRAEASAIEAKGLAEAAAIEAKGKAIKEYGQGALLQELITNLPEIIKASADPIGRGGLTVISNDGASKLQEAVTGGVTGGFAAVKAATGIDLLGMLGGSLAGGSVDTEIVPIASTEVDTK